MVQWLAQTPHPDFVEAPVGLVVIALYNKESLMQCTIFHNHGSTRKGSKHWKKFWSIKLIGVGLCSVSWYNRDLFGYMKQLIE